MFLRQYGYDDTPLNAKILGTDASSEDWTRETIAFDAATSTVSASLGSDVIFSNQAVSASQIARMRFARIADPNTYNWYNGIFSVDNVAMAQVPEPISLGLFIVGGLLVARKKH